MEKTPSEIINLLINDTVNNKLHWYYDKQRDYYYCRVRTDKKNNIIDTIFKLSEQSLPYSEFGCYFEEYDDFVIYLDICISKNKKKEIFCKRIQDYQLKLLELSSAVTRSAVNKKDKPK